jgi:hypothetical protein
MRVQIELQDKSHSAQEIKVRKLVKILQVIEMLLNQ